MKLLSSLMVFMVAVLVYGEVYVLKESLTEEPTGATLSPEAVVTTGAGRLEDQQALHVSAGSVSWALANEAGDGFVECWVRPTGWDAATDAGVAVLSLSCGDRRLTVMKAAGAAELHLMEGDRLLQRYPIYEWVEQPWMNSSGYSPIKWKVRNGFDMWHYLCIGLVDGEPRLTVDGFAAADVAVPERLPALSGVVLEGAPGTAFSWLHVVQAAWMTPTALRSRYKSLYRGAADLHQNTVTIPGLATPPTLDGVANDAAWEKAATMVGFSTVRGETHTLRPEAVEARIAYDENYVYMMFHTPFTGELRARQHDRHDAPLWGEESYEMFLHPPYTGVPDFCQLVGNPYSNQAELKNLNVGYDVPWDWKASIGDGYWSAELRASFTDLGFPPPGKAAVWTGNFISTQANAAWSWTQRYNDTGAFGILRFEADAPVIQPGTIDVGERAIRVPMRILGNKTTGELAVALQAYGEGDVLPAKQTLETVMVSPGSEESLVLEVPIDEVPKGTLAMYVRLGETELFYHSVKYPAGEPAVRTPFPNITAPVEAAAVVEEEKELTPEEAAYQAKWSAEEIGNFLLEMPEWQNSSIGVTEKVPAPWEPMRVEGQTVHCWGRSYVYNNSLLPVQIVSQGEELLSGPGRLEASTADGSHGFATATVTIEQVNEGLVRVVTVAQEGPFEARLVTEYEFDGMGRMELELGSPNAHATLTGLTLLLPLREARLYHVSSGQSGHAPLSTSNAVPAEGLVFDSFREVVWAGNTERGLCWFAESMENWPIGSEAGIQSLTADGEMRVKLGDRPRNLERPLRVIFGVQATPMRPKPENSRAMADRGKIHWQWFWGAGQYYPFQDDHIEVARTQVETMRAAGKEVMPCSSIRFYGQYRFHVGPLGENTDPGLMHLENLLFRDTWAISSVQLPAHQIPARHTAPGTWYGKKFQPQGLASYCPASAYQDLYLWRLKKLIDDTGLGAIYLDQPMTDCANSHHGCGYIDYKGDWRADVPIFAQRRMMKRMYQLFHEAHGKTFIKWHASNQLVPPVISFIDIFWDGENYGSGPHKVFEFYSKVLPPGRMQAEHTGLPFGFSADLLPEFETRYAATPASPRDMMGLFMVHDGAVSAVHTTHPRLVRYLQDQRLAMPVDTMQTLYYWQKEPRRRVVPEVVHSILYHDESQALLILHNWGDEPVEAEVALGLLPPNWSVSPLPGQPAVGGNAGGFRVALEPRGVRMLTLRAGE